MNPTAYFQEANLPLVERWLRERSAADRVTLLCEPAAVAAAGQLARRIGPRVSVLCHDRDRLPDGLLPAACITLPLSFEMRPLAYRPELEMPWLAPYYALFLRLWRLGFRETELYSLAGSRRIVLSHMLEAFQGRHRGERCFVVGNGPSLNAIDMTRLRGEITLGSNQCYLGYERWGFAFTYWGICDQYQVEEHGADYELRVACHRAHFFPFEYVPLLHFPEACPVNHVWCREGAHQFSDAADRVYRGYTVTYLLLQIAAVMGCNPIILVGADHNYPLTRRYVPSKTLRRLRRWATRQVRDTFLYSAANSVRMEHIRETRRQGKQTAHTLWERGHAAAPTHFTEQYTDGGARKFAPPEPEEAEADFRCARRWAESSGVTILNATPQSRLEAFEKVELNSLF